jgi:hypothetical protein
VLRIAFSHDRTLQTTNESERPDSHRKISIGKSQNIKNLRVVSLYQHRENKTPQKNNNNSRIILNHRCMTFLILAHRVPYYQSEWERV